MERYPVITGWKSIWRNSPKIELQVYSIPIKILARFFVDKKQDYSKIYMKSKGTIIAKKKKKPWQSGRNTLSNIKTYSTVIIIKKVWYSQRDRHTDKRNRTEKPKTDQCK